MASNARRHQHPIDPQKIERLRRQGLSDSEIADRLGVTHGAVYSASRSIRASANAAYEMPGAYTTMHDCAIPDCKMRIPKEFLMCHRHWTDVPQSMREAVMNNWSGYSNGCNGEGHTAYEHAREEAINAVIRHRKSKAG